MTADIIDFPTHRFTTADLEHLERISENMIVRGIWASCERHTENGKKGPGFRRRFHNRAAQHGEVLPY